MSSCLSTSTWTSSTQTQILPWMTPQWIGLQSIGLQWILDQWIPGMVTLTEAGISARLIRWDRWDQLDLDLDGQLILWTQLILMRAQLIPTGLQSILTR